MTEGQPPSEPVEPPPWQIEIDGRKLVMTPSGNPEGYVGAFPTDIEINGRKLQVTAHFAMVRERMTCVGLDVRSFWSPIGFEPPHATDLVQPVGDDWVEITSPVLRRVRTAEVIEVASGNTRALFEKIAEKLNQKGGRLEELSQAFRPVVDEMFSGERPARRGPKPQLDDAALRDVVAPAYLRAGRKPVQAVRQALEASGPLRPPVTPDQARKAVTAARARGFLPPYEGRGKRSTEESGR